MARSRHALVERLSQAARDLSEQSGPQATMEAAVRLAVTNVRGCDAATLSLVERGRVDTPAYTDVCALEADLLQYSVGVGPCLDAVWRDGMVHSRDLGTDPRWPAWGVRVVRNFDLHSILCFQLVARAQRLGALELYSRRRDAFDEQDRDDGLALAAHVAVALAAAQASAHLTTALGSRTVIGQASGIIMERYGLDAAAAFGVLARVSSQTNVKLRDVAHELVATGHVRGLP